MNNLIKALALSTLTLLMACNKPKGNENEDLSKTTSEIQLINELEGALPHLFTDLDNQVYLSWVLTEGDTTKFQYSKLEEGKWSTPNIIASGNNWFVNWADYPMIATLHGKNFFAHYLAMSSEGTYSYDIKVRMSNDSGQNWNDAFVLHDDGKQAEHGFVSVTPYQDKFLVVWLDGRNTMMQHENMEEHHGAMTLRAAIMNVEGRKLQEWELDNRVCDCCQTTVAITDNGPVVVYRNRSEEEIRDMHVVRLIDNEWTTPVALHDDKWKIAGCPVNGPRSSALGNNVAVAWFTASPNPRVNLAFSSDGGASFSEAFKIDNKEAIGRVDVVLLDSQRALATWMEAGDLVGAIVNDKGTIEKRFLIATSSESRRSGFPQITFNGENIIVAWTDTESGTVKTGLIEF
jgi:hypothetical protein